jgi:FMN-dependent NADH-azoreductase
MPKRHDQLKEYSIGPSKRSTRNCAQLNEVQTKNVMKGKKAILVLASGGVLSEGPWKSWDSVEPYLRQILGFIGIEDVQTVRAEGMNIPPLAIHAVPDGEKAVEALVI